MRVSVPVPVGAEVAAPAGKDVTWGRIISHVASNGVTTSSMVNKAVCLNEMLTFLIDFGPRAYQDFGFLQSTADPQIPRRARMPKSQTSTTATASTQTSTAATASTRTSTEGSY